MKLRSMKLQLRSGTQKTRPSAAASSPGTVCAATSINRCKEFFSGVESFAVDVPPWLHDGSIPPSFVGKTCCLVSLCVSDSSQTLIGKAQSNRLFSFPLSAARNGNSTGKKRKKITPPPTLQKNLQHCELLLC